MSEMIERVAAAIKSCDPSAGATYEQTARAVIKAMVNPTLEMIREGDRFDTDTDMARFIYAAMIESSLKDISKRQEWLDELRENIVLGQIGSGAYEPRYAVMQEMCRTIGIAFPFTEQQEKRVLRDKVNAYFDERNEP